MLGLLLLACADPIEAPAEMEELTLWLFEEWDHEDPAAMEQAVANLVTWSTEVDLDASWTERAYSVRAIAAEEVEGRIEHDRDPADALGVGVLYLSPNRLEAHLDLQYMEDMTPVEPSSPDHYERTIVSAGECFHERACDVMEVVNDITRENVLYEVTYLMEKDFRWVAVEDEERAAMVARSFMPNSHHDGDKISLWQGYSIDLWIPSGAQTLRYQVSWQETELPGLTWETLSGVVASGIEDLLVAQDEYLAEIGGR